MRRKGLSWFLFWLGASHLLSGIRQNPSLIDHDETTRVGLGTITSNEWFVRAAYVASLLSLPGLLVGLVSNRLFACINERDEEDSEDCRRFYLSERLRLARRARHGSASIFWFLAFLILSGLALLLPLDEASWIHTVSLCLTHSVVFGLLLCTSCCIRTDLMLQRMDDELDDEYDDEPEHRPNVCQSGNKLLRLGVRSRRNRLRQSTPGDVHVPRANSCATSLSVQSTIMFAWIVLIFLFAFIFRALLAPICHYINEDNIESTETEVFGVNVVVEEPDTCLDSCPFDVSSAWNYQGIANLLECVVNHFS